MFILYILECMLMFVVGGYSPQEEILKSTGQPITENDILAGSLGWSILISLMLGILLLNKYLRNRWRLKKRRKERIEKGYPQRPQIFTEKSIKFWFIIFLISLLVLVAGIIISIFASDGSSVQFIGALMRQTGTLTTIFLIIIPLFKYLWRKLDV